MASKHIKKAVEEPQIEVPLAGRMEIRAESPWGFAVLLAIIMSPILVLAPYLSWKHPHSNGWQLMLVMYGMFAALAAMPFRFRVVITDDLLSYRFYFFWKHIRWDQVKVINKDCTGVSRGPSDQFAYMRSLFVHAKPGGGGKSFRLNYAPVGDEDIWRLYKRLESFMPKQLRAPRPRRGKERWIPKIFWKG